MLISYKNDLGVKLERSQRMPKVGNQQDKKKKRERESG